MTLLKDRIDHPNHWQHSRYQTICDRYLMIALWIIWGLMLWLDLVPYPPPNANAPSIVLNVLMMLIIIPAIVVSVIVFVYMFVYIIVYLFEMCKAIRDWLRGY